MNKKIDCSIVSNYRDILFGIAAIFVLLTHSSGFAWNDKMPIVPKILQQGSMGVDIFLFLSGIGLFYSMSKNMELRAFYVKRVKRILPTYGMIAIPGFILLDLYICHDGIIRFFADVTTMSYWVSDEYCLWYVPFILLLYLIYPLIFYLIKEEWRHKYNHMLIVCSVVLSIILLFRFPELYNRWEHSLGRIPIFLIGCEMAKTVHDDKRISSLVPISSAFVYVILRVLIILCSAVLSDDMINMLIRYSYIFSTLAIAYLVPLFLTKWKLEGLCRILRWFGKWSLAIYLLHGMLYVIYLKSELGAVYNSVWFYFLGIVPITLLVILVVERIRICPLDDGIF